jgi:O-antigen/teichoic acid export membrane protein
VIDDLKSKAVGGATWLAFSQIGSQVLKFIVAAILARVLSPEDFGLVGIISIFSGFADLFNDMGFAAALIQKRDVNERHFSSVFWLNIFAAALMMALLVLGAPLMAQFFDQPKLTSLARLLSINFLIGSLVIVTRAKLTRDMEYRSLSIIEVCSAAASGVLGITLALLGYGVYALVAQVLSMAACLTLLIWWSSDWRPKWLFDWSAIKELLGFSMSVVGGNMLNYWIRNADNLLIAKFLGSTELGLYSRAYTIMLLPLSQITSVLTRVMFPALASIQRDKARCRKIFLKVIAAISLFTFPAMLGLLVVAEDFVQVVFGSKWTGMIPVLRVLCIVGMLQSVNGTVGWIYNSQGRSDIQFRWVLFGGILTFAAFAIGIRWGILGVATAYAIRVFSTSWLNFSIPGRLIDMTARDVVEVLFPQLLLSLVMASLVAFVGLLIPDDWTRLARFTIMVTTGMLIFFGSVHCFKLSSYTQFLGLVRENGVGVRGRASEPD